MKWTGLDWCDYLCACEGSGWTYFLSREVGGRMIGEMSESGLGR